VKLPNEPDFNDENITQRLAKYHQLYSTWKIEKLKEIDNNLKLIDTKRTVLTCAQCGTGICEFQYVGKEKYDLYRTLTYNPFFFKKLDFNPQDEFCKDQRSQFIKYGQFKYGGRPIDYEFYGCFNNHTFCIKVREYDLTAMAEDVLENFLSTKHEKEELEKFTIRETFYITKYSKFKWLYPDLSQGDFDFENFNYEQMVKVNNDKFKVREAILSRLDCAICATPCLKLEEYQKHLKEKTHRHNLDEFKSSLDQV